MTTNIHYITYFLKVYSLSLASRLIGLCYFLLNTMSFLCTFFRRGFTDYVRRGLSHLKVLLRLGPVSRTLWQPTSPTPAGGGLLICGPQGCGRTTLALTLARELYDAPSFRVFSHLISCKSLKGKKKPLFVVILRRNFRGDTITFLSFLLPHIIHRRRPAPTQPSLEGSRRLH